MEQPEGITRPAVSSTYQMITSGAARLSIHMNETRGEQVCGGRRDDTAEERSRLARLEADRRIEMWCLHLAVVGAVLLLTLLIVNIYSAVTGAPPVPGGINSVLVGVAVTLMLAWIVEFLSRGCRRYILSAGDRGYGQGVLDGLALRADANDGLSR